jgi:CRP-like cAMP-binding protein
LIDLKEVEFKKGDIIQRKGELKSKTYYVHKGLLKTYSMDEKGKEHIFMFAPEGWIVADASAINGPTQLIIEALEDSVLTINYEPLENSKPSSLTLIKRIAVLQKRAIFLMSASAIERYDDFIETYPDIVQRVPQKMIASYLGITPEALSKVKGNKTKLKS